MSNDFKSKGEIWAHFAGQLGKDRAQTETDGHVLLDAARVASSSGTLRAIADLCEAAIRFADSNNPRLA